MEQNEKKTEKVVTGEVKTKKKSSLALAMQRFGIVPSDVEDVKDYIIKEHIGPAIRNLISDLIYSIPGLIFGGENPGTYRRRGGGSRTSYESYYEGGKRSSNNRTKARNNFTYDELEFSSRGDAEEVLDQLTDMMHRYSSVSVADYYDAAGVTCSHTFNYYGWNELEDITRARVVRSSGGWMIKLPRPRPID